MVAAALADYVRWIVWILTVTNWSLKDEFAGRTSLRDGDRQRATIIFFFVALDRDERFFNFAMEIAGPL